MRKRPFTGGYVDAGDRPAQLDFYAPDHTPEPRERFDAMAASLKVV